ncbi:MAG TPA: hypothetical protein VFE14_07255 [Micromonosporaceae bacterium]|nr:hypothetical protein [Micromonosporaceae bacterium]
MSSPSEPAGPAALPDLPAVVEWAGPPVLPADEAWAGPPVGPWAGPPRHIRVEDVALPEPALPAALPPAVFTAPVPVPEPEHELVVAFPVPAPASPGDDRPGIWLPPQAPAVLPSAIEGWLSAPQHPGRRRGPRVRLPGTKRAKPRKGPRRAGPALTALVLLSLLAAFFAWVSVEPLWLAVGHGDRGTATVTTCSGSGVGRRCVGEFTAADGQFTVNQVAMLGVDTGERHAGATVVARMVSAQSRTSYSGDRISLHLRWVLGLLLIIACGLGIALATGAARLDGRQARLGAFVISFTAPLLIAIGFLAASF